MCINIRITEIATERSRNIPHEKDITNLNAQRTFISLSKKLPTPNFHIWIFIWISIYANLTSEVFLLLRKNPLAVR